MSWPVHLRVAFPHPRGENQPQTLPEWNSGEMRAIHPEDQCNRPQDCPECYKQQWYA